MYLLEDDALVKFRSLLQILQEFIFADVEDPNLQRRGSFRLRQKVMQTAPARLHSLEWLGVHDFIELLRNRLVDRVNAFVQGNFDILLIDDVAIEDTLHQ